MILETLGLVNYWVFAILLLTGFYALIVKQNLVKKILGLNIFQSAVFLLYITLNKVEGGTAPILLEDIPEQVYSNPLPQVLILTAIVVGISTTAVALALAVRIYQAYGTVDDDAIKRMDSDA